MLKPLLLIRGVPVAYAEVWLDLVGTMLLSRTTTSLLDDDLCQAVVTRAADAGAVPDRVIERVLREALLKRNHPEAIQALWVTSRAISRPGVDLTDRAHSSPTGIPLLIASTPT